jgi:hypothetical protein
MSGGAEEVKEAMMAVIHTCKNLLGSHDTPILMQYLDKDMLLIQHKEHLLTIL